MNRRPRYAADVLAVPAKKQPPPRHVTLRLGLRLTDRVSRFEGTVVEYESGVVILEADDDGGRRAFPFEADRFAQGGKPIRLTKGGVGISRPATLTSASGARVAATQTAKVARASRIWVEGKHDAQLLEKVWGEELRELAIVVEPLHGADDLPAAIRAFQPSPTRRLGVLLDHLVPGSKETRIAAEAAQDHVLIAGHPYVDVWAGVRPRVLGLPAWPDVPRGRPWKEGVAAALGVRDHRDVWRRALGGVSSLADLETPLIGAVEQLLDFLVPDQVMG
ncbi:DUF3097 family protein [Euzebya tangerina]|uniref:DUF3097 family protein n=1 Tax=Euzebya tangerina TaxID=591198 RepID=UPI000E321060|nr:DUF3097 family protein [Euzebya tangerina]